MSWHSYFWLLEDDPDRQLTDEEVFARDLFLAKRGATSLTDLRDYMEGDLYREKEDLYSRNEEARDRELSAFRNFTDVRLLGVVRYGEFHFFLNVIKRPGETSSEIRAGFAARKNEGRYMQTGDPASHIATTFFRPGFLQDEIYMELERFVQ